MFYYSEKKFLLYRIIQLFCATALIILLINAISFGVFTMTQNAIKNGYGDIYIQLNKKMTKKLFFKKNIQNTLMKNKYISNLDIYGVVNALLIAGDRHIPVYLLSFFQMQSQLFLYHDVKYINKNIFYCGDILYKKYNALDKKK